MSTTAKERREVLERMERYGIAIEDREPLRRVAMTLHRWHELECGDSNDHGSWSIERDANGDGPPFMVRHLYLHGRGADYMTRTRIPDREAGAHKRLAKIMERYKDKFIAYVQGDPRGAALWLVPLDSLKPGDQVDSVYTRGLAIY